MKKQISPILFTATLLFVAITFASSNFQNSFSSQDSFGYPFVFLQASYKDFSSQADFSIIALLADISLYLGASFVIVKFIQLIKMVGKKNLATS